MRSAYAKPCEAYTQHIPYILLVSCTYTVYLAQPCLCCGALPRTTIPSGMRVYVPQYLVVAM